MTHEACIDALRQQGYTTGQVNFLARVMVHGGYCLRRQVAAATGHADGGMATAFLRRLVARGHARVRRCARRGLLYQVTSPRLYAAIGEPDRPSRRRVSLTSVLRRLMTLDVVLAHQAWRVLGTEREKVDHFTRDRGLSPQLVPETWNSGHRGRGSLRAFAEGGPVLISPQDDGVTFVYVQGPATTVTGWTTFLVAYAPLLTVLPRVEVLFATVDPMGFGARAQAAFAAWQRTARQRRETELRRTRAALERLFRLRMAVRSGGVDLLRGWDPHAVRRLGSRQVHPRYAGLYGDWSVAGSRILDRFIAAEPRVQVAHVGCRVWALPHRYDLFGTAAARSLCSDPGAASPMRERLHSARHAAA
jgi:hypothetical protein